MKVVIIFHRLGPYHYARLQAVAKYCDLTAIELSLVDNTYAWDIVNSHQGIAKVTLFLDSDVDDRTPSEIRKNLWDALQKCDPQVVFVPGWGSISALLALQWCRQENIPAVVMSESQEIDEPRAWWKESCKSWIVKQFSAGFVGGGPHVDYLAKLGLLREQICVGYDVIDNNFFANGSTPTHRNLAKSQVEESLPKQFFLNSSRFIKKKNLMRLVEAYAYYRNSVNGSAWDLVILGDGPLRSHLEAGIDGLGLTSSVHLPGFKQYNELPAYYGLAEVYVHASTTEQWGLVVNEAMAAGLPVLVSERCGCAPDLVENGRNGYTFDPFNVEALAELMVKISQEDTDREAMGQASREIISGWTPETFADNLLKAARCAIDAPHPDPTLLDKVLLWALGPK